MPDQSTTAQPEHAPREHLPGGKNPRHDPEPHLDASPPQPDAPPQSPIEEQQDQQPVSPEPLLKRPEPIAGQQREHRNG